MLSNMQLVWKSVGQSDSQFALKWQEISKEKLRIRTRLNSVAKDYSEMFLRDDEVEDLGWRDVRSCWTHKAHARALQKMGDLEKIVVKDKDEDDPKSEESKAKESIAEEASEESESEEATLKKADEKRAAKKGSQSCGSLSQTKQTAKGKLPKPCDLSRDFFSALAFHISVSEGDSSLFRSLVTILLTIVAASNISSAPAGVSDSIPVSANDEVLSSAYIKEKTLKKLSKQQLMGPYAMKKVQIQNKEQLELVRVEIRVSSLFNQPSCSLLEGMSKLEGIGSTERERLWPELVQSFKDIFQRLKLNKVEEAEEAWWWWSRHRLYIRRSMARDEKTKGW
ncbi:hypothetical protein Bca52824_041141 [Brassica carinata]|uniref:Uncharacterized protein n=1 Tax=Brassica carinata TaxID=52824 RepID=A0A8X7RUU0_BRACI|nr:hypothetical protein Bca52824_041141 [Brassica carinata]